jgi:hypothetical protein
VTQARYDPVADFYADGFDTADVVGADISAGLLARALDIERSRPLGIRYLHPCFTGGTDVSGSWPPDGRYYDEVRWTAACALSGLRAWVGASHRTLSTYLNTLRGHGLWLDRLAEPEPAPDWAAGRPDSAGKPVFLAARCVRR